MIEILCNGVVHYRRPSMDDPDVQEALLLIDWHERLCGKSSYEVREVNEEENDNDEKRSPSNSI